MSSSMTTTSAFTMLPTNGVLKVSQFHGTNIEGAVAIPFDSERTRARLALLMAREAVEHAGYSASDYCNCWYLDFQVQECASWDEACGVAHGMGIPVRYPSEVSDEGGVDIPSFWTDEEEQPAGPALCNECKFLSYPNWPADTTGRCGKRKEGEDVVTSNDYACDQAEWRD